MLPASGASQEILSGLPGQQGKQHQALPESVRSNASSPDSTATPPSPEAEPQRAPGNLSGSDGSVMSTQGFKPGPLPKSSGMIGVSQVSGRLRAPVPGSIPVVKDAEQQKKDHHGGVDEEGRSQRGSTGGSENDGEGYGTAQASMPRNFRISLEGYSLQKDDDGTFAAYRINVTAGLHTWHVLRRWVSVVLCCVCAFHFRLAQSVRLCLACDPRACGVSALRKDTQEMSKWTTSRCQPSVVVLGSLASIFACLCYRATGAIAILCMIPSQVVRSTW